MNREIKNNWVKYKNFPKLCLFDYNYIGKLKIIKQYKERDGYKCVFLYVQTNFRINTIILSY